MFNPQQLHWDDISSDILEGHAYLDHISDMRDRIMHQSNYKAYKVDEVLILELKEFFRSTDKSLKILTLGATWCQTCADVKPTLIKIVEAVDSSSLKIFLLGGVKITMRSTEEDYSWARTSPPEFHDPKFAVNQIPLVFFFDGDGVCLTRIEKYPRNGISFERAILNVAHTHFG